MSSCTQTAAFKDSTSPCEYNNNNKKKTFALGEKYFGALQESSDLLRGESKQKV